MVSKFKKISLTKDNILSSPNSYGVYIFWDKNKKPLYIGKSNELKKRLSSYLSRFIVEKTAKMVSESKYFSTITVNSEIEALLLEAKLVNLVQPKYNSQLKDDKQPLYIKITKDEYPQVVTCRKGKLNNSSFFVGPFPHSGNVKTVMKILRKTFPYSQHKPGKRECLYKQMGLCNPCPSEIINIKDEKKRNEMKKRYRKNIYYIKNILSGRFTFVIKSLQKSMRDFSKNQKYEEAAQKRDQIEFLKYVTQPVTSVASYLKDPNFLEDTRAKESETLKNLLVQYIRLGHDLKRIECFDVAHLSGAKPTASMVTFVEGEPDKSYYRHFKIHQKNTSDDISSMKEVAERRIRHFDDWGVPDIVIVDGGRAQAAIFWSVFKAYQIPIVGLAKRHETLVIPVSSRGKLTFKEKVVPKGPALNLLQRIRDEAHRFARKLHHKQLEKELIPK